MDQLKADESLLEADQAIVKAIDETLKKERNLAFADEKAISKKTDEWLAALSKGDDKKAAVLKSEIQVITQRYAEEEKIVKELTAEEAKDVEAEKKLLAKVKAEEKTELDTESKELVEAEEAEMAKNLDATTLSKVSKFFK